MRLTEMQMRAAMTARVFADTNLLVYAVHGGDEPHKTTRAREVLTLLRETSSGTLSAQVVGEFVSVATRKLSDTLRRPEALRVAALLMEQFAMVDLSETVVREALRACDRYGLDYFDAQIWAAARLSGCHVILTEDLHGETLEGVAYLNPFSREFDTDEFAAREIRTRPL